MESVDPKKLQVLIKSKKDQKWEDLTAEVVRVRCAGNRIYVTFKSGKEWPYGTGRVRIYKQVKRWEIRPLDLVYVDGALRRNVECVYELRTSDASVPPRYLLESRTKEGALDTCICVGDAVMLDCVTEIQRQCIPIMKYVHDEVCEQARRIGATRQSNGNKSWWTCEDAVKPDALLASLWEELPKAPSGSALEAYLRGTSSTQTGASDRIIMPFPSNIDQ